MSQQQQILINMFLVSKAEMSGNHGQSRQASVQPGLYPGTILRILPDLALRYQPALKLHHIPRQCCQLTTAALQVYSHAARTGPRGVLTDDDEDEFADGDRAPSPAQNSVHHARIMSELSIQRVINADQTQCSRALRPLVVLYQDHIASWQSIC